MTDFSSENMEARRKWYIFQVLGGKNQSNTNSISSKTILQA